MLAALSCQRDVDLTNPFDPDITASKPEDLRMVSLSETSLSLAWKEAVHFSSPSQVSSALIFVESSSDGRTFSLLDSTGAGGPTCTINRMFVLNKIYYFRIYRRWGTQKTPMTNVVSSTATFSNPSHIAVASLDETKRRLTWQWQQVSEPAAWFRVERRAGTDAAYALLQMVPGNLLAFTDSSVIVTNRVYTYRICAVTATGTSSGHDSVNVLIPFLPPTGFSCTGSDSLRAVLRWTNSFAYPSEAVIERSVGNGPFLTVGTVPAGQNSFVDSLVDKYHGYQYRVWLKTAHNTTTVSTPVRCCYQATGLSFSRLLTTGLAPGTGQQGILSDDEQLFVSVGSSELSIVDFRSGQVQRKIASVVPITIANVALSRNKEWCATIDWHESAACVYRIQDGQFVRKITGTWPGIDLALSNDGTRLYTCFGGGDVSCWNIADGTRLWQRTLTSGVNSMWLLPDGDRLLVGLHDDYFLNGTQKGCLLLDVRTGATISEHPGGTFKRTPHVSAAGDVRIIGATNGTCYNITQNTQEFTAPLAGAANWLSADRQLAVFVSIYGTSCLYNVVAGNRITTDDYYHGHQTGWHKYTRMINNDRQFIIYDQEGDIGFYDITYGWAAY
jgi:WD40 repeat protein